MSLRLELPPLRDRAAATWNEIERHFAMGDGRYRDKAGQNGTTTAWPLGVLISSYVAGAAFDPRRCLPRLQALGDSLRRDYYRADPPGGFDASAGHGGLDRYYDDNAWLALTFGDAAHKRLGPSYHPLALDALRFTLAGRKGDGILWHEQHPDSENTCSTAPGALAALLVGDDAATAHRLYDWLRATLRDPADGLYWDNIEVATGKIGKAKWSYNTALVLRLELAFAARGDGKVYRDSATETADAALAHWYDDQTASLRDDASFAHLLNEAFLLTFDLTRTAKYRKAALASLDTLWTRVRGHDGSYPKRWDKVMAEEAPTELLWIASAARGYAFAAPYETAR
jgi:hypothetical protein